MRHVAAALVLVGWQVVGAAATPPVAGNVREFPSVLTRFWVEQAIQGAARRLRKPACTRVLSDFTDADGRPLGERLGTLGVSAEQYVLTGLWFYEGHHRPFCDPKFERAAVTQPGSRVVFICSDRFVNESREREITIIHEMLHSLGLGENPPSTREITKQVAARCGR